MYMRKIIPLHNEHTQSGSLWCHIIIVLLSNRRDRILNISKIFCQWKNKIILVKLCRSLHKLLHTFNLMIHACYQITEPVVCQVSLSSDFFYPHKLRIFHILLITPGLKDSIELLRTVSSALDKYITEPDLFYLNKKTRIFILHWRLLKI